MKKLLFTLLTLATVLTAAAKDYTGTLTVTVNGEGTSTASTISVVPNGGGSYTLSINNFTLEGIPVGNIVVTGQGVTENGLTSIVTTENITIAAGDDEGEWLGPLLGEVPINMVLAFNDYAMTTNIDIYMAELEQNINVKFAMDGELTGYQIKNSGFEDFKSNGEPFAWHGFKSASGTWASAAKGTLASSTDVRTGATGTNSAVITSGSVFGIVNNGTMTTGKLNAGSTSATNTANHSEMDMSSTGTDANGDPFYTVMHGRPDAIKFWLKFTQAKANSSYPYATMSAIITDGTYYQDPEDKTYTNKLATAKNNTIRTCAWTEFTVPFTYVDKSITGKALLVTFSTNATPGQGSSGDKVYVDDIELVYNAAITAISLKGAALEGFAQDVYEYSFDVDKDFTITDADVAATYVSENAYLVKRVVETENGYKVFVAVVSNDLNTTKVYTISYNKPAAPAEVTLDGVTFGGGKQWATWYGDRNLAVPENVTAYVVTGVTDDAAQIAAVNYLPGNTGLLLYSTTEMSEVTTTATDATGAPESKLQGTLESTAVSDAYVLYDNTFVRAQNGSTLAAHRCYLPASAAAAAPVLRIGSLPTAIQGIIAGGKAVRYVNLQGVQSDTPWPGVNIVVDPNSNTTTKTVK